MKIGVFDSGKGRRTILEAIERLVPEAEYMYIADSEHCPYGEKTDDELMKIVENVVERLRRWGAEIVVVACNTATTRCIGQLRELYPELRFVGTEPAIRLATRSDARRILVMATPGTIQSERMAKLVSDNQQSGQEIALLACPGLADAIERDEDVELVLKTLLSGMDLRYDLVVLGCTHYSLIKSKIQRFFPTAKLVDGNEGVARRVKQLVDSMD